MISLIMNNSCPIPIGPFTLSCGKIHQSRLYLHAQALTTVSFLGDHRFITFRNFTFSIINIYEIKHEKLNELARRRYWQWDSDIVFAVNSTLSRDKEMSVSETGSKRGS